MNLRHRKEQKRNRFSIHSKKHARKKPQRNAYAQYPILGDHLEAQSEQSDDVPAHRDDAAPCGDESV